MYIIRDEKDGGEEQAWHDRCIELEESLASFRDQAHRIREILKEKVSVISLLPLVLKFQSPTHKWGAWEFLFLLAEKETVKFTFNFSFH